MGSPPGPFNLGTPLVNISPEAVLVNRLALKGQSTWGAPLRADAESLGLRSRLSSFFARRGLIPRASCRQFSLPMPRAASAASISSSVARRVPASIGPTNFVTTTPSPLIRNFSGMPLTP